ncbi:MAG TPA: hypothetical protein VFP44_17410 [Usitatibacter sp.]|nr:hypothetical protein [Usitatibacter sp.]
MSAAAPVDRGMAKLRADLAANHRLRWGVWAIVAILWIYGILVLRDAARAERAAAEQASRRIAALEQVAAERDWPARWRSAEDVRQKLEGRLWHAGTLGLAQAAFQDWLNETVQQAGVRKPVVAVAAQEDSSTRAVPGAASTEPAAAPDLWKTTARVAFDFEPAALYRFLQRLASNDKAVVVESLTIRGTPGGRVEMGLVAWFQKPGTLTRNAGGDAAGKGG